MKNIILQFFSSFSGLLLAQIRGEHALVIRVIVGAAFSCPFDVAPENSSTQVS